MALATAFVLVATGAVGQTSPPAGDEAARLVSSRSTVVYDLAMGSSSIRAGGAMVAINAPVAAVRAVITDYAHYQEIVPGFQRTRVVAKGPQGTDVYLAAPILHGAATLWAVTRFPPPVPEGPGERIEAHRNGDANVEDFRATWHLYPVDDNHSLLKLELLMVPKLPLPGGLLTPHFQMAASAAVKACRDRAEARALANNAPESP